MTHGLRLWIDTTPGHEDRGAPIPSRLRRPLERLLGCDLSPVRLQVDRRLAPLGAYASAQGEDIRLSPAAPDLETPAGMAILGHELAHVLQQRAGRVPRASAGNPVVDLALEAEADRIGAHCAARLFPGSGEDPGLPPCAQTEARPREAGPAPIQFLRTSVQSFRDFITGAWQLLRMPAAQNYSEVGNLRRLYNLAATYNPNAVPPKVSLFGAPRYQAMTTYIQATQIPTQHRIRIQDGNWPDVTNQVGTFAAYYTAVANMQSPPLNAQAEKLALRYLHVYPAQQAPADWRIGLNVKPPDMAAAMTALAPLLDQFRDIDHMKFLSPGLDSKADSVIVYLRRSQAYAQLRDAVSNAVEDLDLEPRVGAMWNEIDDGIGEAAEPPAGSFTSYRCVVVYLAYLNYRAKQPSFAGFLQYLTAVMALFGLDPASPHTQGPRDTQNPVYDSWWQAFTTLHNAWQQ
jgi:hypothetical protein